MFLDGGRGACTICRRGGYEVAGPGLRRKPRDVGHRMFRSERAAQPNHPELLGTTCAAANAWRKRTAAKHHAQPDCRTTFDHDARFDVKFWQVRCFEKKSENAKYTCAISPRPPPINVGARGVDQACVPTRIRFFIRSREHSQTQRSPTLIGGVGGTVEPRVCRFTFFSETPVPVKTPCIDCKTTAFSTCTSLLIFCVQTMLVRAA